MMPVYSYFKTILEDDNRLERYLEINTQYYAHSHLEKESETLYEHTELVKVYFERLVRLNGLELIIDKMIDRVSFDNREIGEFIKILFSHTISFHDVGKLNPNFQAIQMKNRGFNQSEDIVVGTQHSFISGYAFVSYHLDLLLDMSNQQNIGLLMPLVFLFSVPILKHHSSTIDKDYNFEQEKVGSIHHLIDFFDLRVTFDNLIATIDFERRCSGQNLWTQFDETAKRLPFDYFSLFALLKLNYSLLTASDYYATSEYMVGLKFSTEVDFGLMTNEYKKELIHGFDNNRETPYNGDLLRDIDLFKTKSIDDLHIQNNENLNILRQKMGAEVLATISKESNQRVFYLEAPTGGGKTNMSMLAARRLFDLKDEINKIFYVFPFTTLITQTAQAISKTFNIPINDIALLHSKASFQTRDNRGDGSYDNEKRNEIDNIFVNYPISLLTHIKFFDVLKSNRKKSNYLMHRLANSIVIIDELQSYNPKHWDKIKYFIAQYAELFNITFIVMSATLPKIDNIDFGDNNFAKFKSLIPNASRYLQNNNFANRVSINTDLLNSTIELETLADVIVDKSRIYAETRSDEFNGGVYTIVELIFKKSARELYDYINSINEFFDHLFLLSGTVVEPRRRYIIEYLKDDKNRNKRILLVTTQVVEAGVDIDMDLGFKNQSLLDSDEQLAGRINRNTKKDNCQLFLFKYNEPNTIYGKDLRYKATLEFKPEFINEILTKKKFHELYERVFSSINQINRSTYKENLNDYLKYIERLDFGCVDSKFRLIDSDTCTLFVPVNISVNCYNTIRNFSSEEIHYLLQSKCIEDKLVIGELVWNLYLSIVSNRHLPILTCKRELMLLNGVISKFTISIYSNKIESLKPFLDYNENYSEYNYAQYLKLQLHNIGDDRLYTIEDGLNEEKLDLSYDIF